MGVLPNLKNETQLKAEGKKGSHSIRCYSHSWVSHDPVDSFIVMPIWKALFKLVHHKTETKSTTTKKDMKVDEYSVEGRKDLRAGRGQE